MNAVLLAAAHLLFPIQSHVAAGDQLVHSAFLQSLASLAVGLCLEKHLCRFARPPHHPCPDAYSCPSEWSWLAAYATTVRSAEAIASGTAFPETFVVSGFKEVQDNEIAKALVNRELFLLPTGPCFFLENTVMVIHRFLFQDNSKWSFKMDEQLMSWATTRPEVTVQPSGISAQ